LHAKCAVADEAAAFISSANLTKYALNLNAQKGVYTATLPTKCWF
jgi:phosphatidylserine/phosphatidylglycerophosphate/cardiolipin synthase-like enzyme